MTFKKATKEQGRLRLAISSPAGAGKTYTAQRIAKRLAERFGGRVAVIDTEHGSASKYADEFDFDSSELVPPFTPERYIQQIREAATAGYRILIIDSASHEWNGTGGCLEMVDDAARRAFKGNKWAAWSEVTPQHNRFIEAILASGMHIIATFRSKTETAQTEQGGQKKVEKLGMAAIAREGTEYEFDVVGEIDMHHRMQITKTRCKALTDQEFLLPGEDIADILIAWLSDGAPAEPKALDGLGMASESARIQAAEMKERRLGDDPDPRPAIVAAFRELAAKQDDSPFVADSIKSVAVNIRDALMECGLDTGQVAIVMRALTGQDYIQRCNTRELKALVAMADAGTLPTLAALA